MNRDPRCIVLSSLLVAAFSTHAQRAVMSVGSPLQASTDAADAATTPAPATGTGTAQQARVEADSWNAALGLLGAIRPQYPGAPHRVFKATPAFYLRYGRYTVTNASSLAPRRTEDVSRGLGVELIESDTLRASLSLRYDSGRSEHSSPAYQGLGRIPHTVRARAAVSWQLAGPWRLGASWSPDALGRGNGSVGDVSLGWDRRLSEHTTLSASSALSFGDRRYMQAYYGIDAAQSARSSYTPYRATPGARDIGVGVNLRREFGKDWTAQVGAGASKLLGSAANSPITRQSRGYGISCGVARQF
jgi:outer membrane protein